MISDNDDDLALTGKDADFSGHGKDVRNSADDILKDEKKNKKRGMLSWFKMRKQDASIGSPVVCPENENFPNGSPPASAGSSTHSDLVNEFKSVHQKSSNKRMDELSPVIDSFPGATQAGELFSVTSCGWKPPPTGTTMADQMDLLKEQVKMLAGEVAFCTSSLKRLSEQVSNNPDDTQSKVQILKLEDEIEEKKQQMRILQQRMIGIGEASSNGTSLSDLQQVIANLMSQLDEKTFELEIMSADNRILQEQFQAKSDENDEAQETILLLRQQLASALEKHPYQSKMANDFTAESAEGEMYANVGARTELVEEEDHRGSCEELRGQMLLQAAEIEKLKQDKVQLIEEKGGLQIQGQKLAEEATYAKELASAAAVELKNLAEEVSRLSFQNTKLAKELETAQDIAFSRTSKLAMANGLCKYSENKMDQMQNLKNMIMSGGTEFESDIIDDIDSWNLDSEDVKRELRARKEREAALEAILVGKEQTEAELQKKIDEYRKREADLENDLAGMWVLVANLRKESGVTTDVAVDNDVKQDMQIINNDGPLKIQRDENNTREWEKDKKTIEELTSCLENEKRQGTELDRLIAQLKSEDLEGLDLPTLEDLQSLHVEALTKLSQVKAQMQEKFGKENECDSLGTICKEKTNDHICRICFQTPIAAILLPCLHFCSCKPCAAACTECPLCRTQVSDRIMAVTS